MRSATSGAPQCGVTFESGWRPCDSNWQDRGPEYPRQGEYEARDSLRRLRLVTFEAGVRHGPRRVYYPNGRLGLHDHFEDGQRHGPVRLYYESGALALSLDSVRGHPQGLCEHFYRDGKLRCSGLYGWDGRRQGRWTFWDAKGDVHAVGAYHNSQQNGTWTFHDRVTGRRTTACFLAPPDESDDSDSDSATSSSDGG